MENQKKILGLLINNQPSNNNNIKNYNKDGEEKKLVKFFGAI